MPRSKRRKYTRKPKKAKGSSTSQSIIKSAEEDLKDTGPSRFLQLPGEIRNLIYTWHFSSFGINFVENYQFPSVLRETLVPHPLALLQTCQQVNRETRNLWLGLVVFNFIEVDVMLYKLSELPLATRSQIRHLRVSTHFTPGRSGSSSRVENMRRGQKAFKFPRGLQLDRLTVFVLQSGQAAYYRAVEDFVRFGVGWKELHLLTFELNLLDNFFVFSGPTVYQPQPSTWNRILQERDGVSSGASVTIFKTIPRKGDFWKSLVYPTFYQFPYQQNVEPFDSDATGFVNPQDTGKELLIVVKRGRHADVAVPLPPGSWTDGMTASRVRRLCMSF